MTDEAVLPVAPTSRQGAPAYAAALRPPAVSTEGWTASVPDLPGCTSAGDSARDCMANIADAVEAWFVAALREGRAAPEPSSLDDLANRLEYRGALWMLVQRRQAAAVDLSSRLGIDATLTIGAHTDGTGGQSDQPRAPS